MKHKEDDEVLAKDLDTGEFHKAKIIGISGNKYIVLFNNGEESLLKETEVKVNIKKIIIIKTIISK